ncbi:hypothetical protein IWW48_004069 [Coemansia sp. RSA 1200]|nr:hypothetical protein IWW48_004069 [Coemansia sp. RSA 1200]
MDAASEIAPFPSAASAGVIAGGIASGLWCSGHSGTSLLYRYTSLVLEVRSMAPPALEGPEALATLCTTQLQTDTVNDLTIVLVKPVVLNDTTHMLVYAHEEHYQLGRLYVFNPFTLTVLSISTAIPYNVSSLSASAPFRAGSGSSTEWEYTLVCFGLANSKALVGNLTIGVDCAQLTALEAFELETGKHKVNSSVAIEIPDSGNHSVIFMGLTSGDVAAVEYSPSGLGRGHVLGITSDSARLGSVACLSAVVLDSGRFLVCAGHNSSGARAAGSAVATYIATLGSSKSKKKVGLSFESIGVDRVCLAPSDSLDGQDQEIGRIVADAAVIELKIHDTRSTNKAIQTENNESGIVIAALALSLADDGRRANGSRCKSTYTPESGMTHGLFNAWQLLVNGAMETKALSYQSISGSDMVLGMNVSGKLSQVEVVTDRRVFIGDSLSKSVLSADDGSTCSGESVTACAKKYLGIDDRFAYPLQVRRALAEQRRQMDGELFIDILLHMAGISSSEKDGHSVYPPKSPAEQSRFIARIDSSDLDNLKKHCIVYYLVLDYAADHLVSSNGTYAEFEDDSLAPVNSLAMRYANKTIIPRHFVYLMRGYWLMDHGQINASVSYLSDPTVIADWAPKIFSSIVSSGHFKVGLQFLNSTTAMGQPRLEDQPSNASLVMEVLLHCDIGRAFTFQRKYTSTPDLRDALLSQLFSFAFSPHARRAVVNRLSVFPFDISEETALNAYCLRTDTPIHAKDFLALYYVNRGRYVEAIRLFKDISKAEADQHLDGTQMRKHNERAAMVQNLIMLLPEAQKWVVEELDIVSDEHDGNFPQNQLGLSKYITKAQFPGNAEGPWALGNERVPDFQASAVADHGSEAAFPSHNASSSSKKIHLNQPLSASKSARHIHAAVGTDGRAQSNSRPLVRLLLNQKFIVNPESAQHGRQITSAVPLPAIGTPHRANTDTGSGISGTANVFAPLRPLSRDAFETQSSPQDTPWVTSMPLASRNAAKSMSLCVPFFGPPSTQSIEKNTSKGADQPTDSSSRPFAYPDNRSVHFQGKVGSAVPVSSSLAVKNVPEDLPSPVEAGRSPFERTHVGSNMKMQQFSPEPPLQHPAFLAPRAVAEKQPRSESEDSSVPRYNLRNRADISAPSTPSKNERDPTTSSSKQVQGKHSDAYSATSKESARSYERALRQGFSDNTDDSNGARGRKRT